MQKVALWTLSTTTLSCRRLCNSSFPFPILANELFTCPELPRKNVSSWQTCGMSEVHLECKSVGVGIIENEITHIYVRQDKVKLSLYRPRRPLVLREVEAPIFSDIRHTDGGKVVSPTRRPLFTRRKIPGTHFCQRLSRLQGHSAAGRIR
jgi:hypothetical protein